MHINQIKEIAKIITAGGTTNKEQQSCILGYIIGLEAPLSLNMQDPNDDLECNSFLNDIAGDINEHFVLNLALAQDVANLTLQYRQAVANATDEVFTHAEKFLQLTGAAFGMLGEKGMITQIRNRLKNEVIEKRQGIEERRSQREVVEDEKKEM